VTTMRIGKWVIVLFLLAALPGMTGVMAQGQEPAGKAPLPAQLEPATTTVGYGYWETEPNNAMGQAQTIGLGDVIGAMFSPANTDVDYFKFRVYDQGTAILVDTDLDESGADTVVTLFRSDGVAIGSNDDADGLNSLLYRLVVPGWYYLKVENHPAGQGCSQCTYEVMVTSPLLISAYAANLGAAPSVEGIPFDARDILAFSYLNDDHLGNVQHKWTMFVDASDIGFTKQVVNVSTGWVCNSAHLAVGFAANQPLVDYQGIARIAKPWDWVIFDLEEVGPNTYLGPSHGGLEVHSGLEHGLSTTGEKLDALAVKNWDCGGSWLADIYFSTVGAGLVNKAGGGTFRPADEDIFLSEIGQGWTGGWRNYLRFDGSTVPGLGVEDVFAADYDPESNVYHMTILGSGRIHNNHPVTQKDIFSLYWYGGAWQWNAQVWHGPDYGWNYNIDAFDWPDQLP